MSGAGSGTGLFDRGRVEEAGSRERTPSGVLSFTGHQAELTGTLTQKILKEIGLVYSTQDSTYLIQRSLVIRGIVKAAYAKILDKDLLPIASAYYLITAHFVPLLARVAGSGLAKAFIGSRLHNNFKAKSPAALGVVDPLRDPLEKLAKAFSRPKSKKDVFYFEFWSRLFSLMHTAGISDDALRLWTCGVLEIMQGNFEIVGKELNEVYRTDWAYGAAYPHTLIEQAGSAEPGFLVDDKIYTNAIASLQNILGLLEPRAIALDEGVEGLPGAVAASGAGGGEPVTLVEINRRQTAEIAELQAQVLNFERKRANQIVIMTTQAGFIHRTMNGGWTPVLKEIDLRKAQVTSLIDIWLTILSAVDQNVSASLSGRDASELEPQMYGVFFPRGSLLSPDAWYSESQLEGIGTGNSGAASIASARESKTVFQLFYEKVQDWLFSEESSVLSNYPVQMFHGTLSHIAEKGSLLSNVCSEVVKKKIRYADWTMKHHNAAKKVALAILLKAMVHSVADLKRDVEEFKVSWIDKEGAAQFSTLFPRAFSRCVHLYQNIMGSFDSKNDPSGQCVDSKKLSKISRDVLSNTARPFLGGSASLQNVLSGSLLNELSERLAVAATRGDGRGILYEAQILDRLAKTFTKASQLLAQGYESLQDHPGAYEEGCRIFSGDDMSRYAAAIYENLTDARSGSGSGRSGADGASSGGISSPPRFTETSPLTIGTGSDSTGLPRAAMAFRSGATGSTVSAFDPRTGDPGRAVLGGRRSSGVSTPLREAAASGGTQITFTDIQSIQDQFAALAEMSGTVKS